MKVRKKLEVGSFTRSWDNGTYKLWAASVQFQGVSESEVNTDMHPYGTIATTEL